MSSTKNLDAPTEGTNTASGGLHIVDISNPLNPTILGTFAEDGYTHDAQVVNYIGDDPQYQGREIAFACNENTVTIVDVTDPTDATLIAAEGYSGSAYTHQGWLTEDHKYFVVGDELDEQNFGVNTKTYFFNVEDLDNPFLANTYTASTAAIDHNPLHQGRHRLPVQLPRRAAHVGREQPAQPSGGGLLRPLPFK